MPSSQQRFAARANFVHREILKLAVLIALAVGAFFLTRAVAASNRQIELQNGLEWYERGQRQLSAGEVDVAVDSFRRAAGRNRGEKRYVLALARALTTQGDDDAAARSALLALRILAPEDADINLQLARIAALRRDVAEALSYYQNALYAPWPIEQIDGRRQVRFELIRFLVAHDEIELALSELLAATADLPDDENLHIQVAQLYAEAGDGRQALEHFQSALTLTPDSPPALAGAGFAAFGLADYPLGRQYLRRAPPEVEGVQEAGELVELVLENDPLAARIGAAARARRLVANLSHAMERLDGCLEERAGEPPPTPEETDL